MRFAILLALILWTGCNQIAGIYEGEKRSCSTVTDCDVGVAGCRTAECKADECVYVDKPAGTLLEDQVVGDCQELRCDGQGRSTIVTLPTDHDDSNPCTDDSCVGSTPTHKVIPFVACFTGPAVNRNQGICHDGRQACDANGNLVGPCVGEVLPAPNETCLSIYDDDCDGEINEASGDACMCEKDTYRECYGSTVESLDVGPCVSGFQKCMEGLFYGPCENQVTPKPESCVTLSDDDCDGLVNEAGADCVCGDEIISSGEECDDGNKLDGDGCTSDCEFPNCGNGVMEDGEQCDDGNGIDTDLCTQKCRIAICGDGLLHIGVEICDDGNLLGGDGCQKNCVPSPTMLSLGFMHSCALFSNGSVKCWGNNASGQLGLGDAKVRGEFADEMGANLPTIDLGKNRTAKQLVAGSGHTCALLDDDSVKCWGNNDYGQLGLDSKMYYGVGPGTMGDALPVVNLGEKARQLATGLYHTCAILESGNVKCWGDNAFGKLGIGSTTTWGDKPGDMGMLPIVPLSPGKKAIHVAVGLDHSCVLEDDLGIRCWGSGSSGKLAQGNLITLGDTPGTAGGAIVNIGSGRVPMALVPGAGSGSGVRLQSGGLLWWGSNGYCQLGLGHSNDIGDSVNEIGDQMPLVNLGSGQQVVEAGFGQRHQCALLTGGVVRCWGANDAGQLGRAASCATVGDAVGPVDLGLGFFAAVIATGGVHTCAISLNGRVKCWGSNGSGQLGLGDVMTRGLNAAEMGNALPVVRLW